QLPGRQESLADWKSYSYRLMGRILYCKREFRRARRLLKRAVRLSPQYADALFDLSTYAAYAGDRATSLEALGRAIDLKPLFWKLARYHRAFKRLAEPVKQVLLEKMPRAKAAAAPDVAVYAPIARVIRRRLEQM